MLNLISFLYNSQYLPLNSEDPAETSQTQAAVNEQFEKVQEQNQQLNPEEIGALIPEEEIDEVIHQQNAKVQKDKVQKEQQLSTEDAEELASESDVVIETQHNKSKKKKRPTNQEIRKKKRAIHHHNRDRQQTEKSHHDQKEETGKDNTENPVEEKGYFSQLLDTIGESIGSLLIPVDEDGDIPFGHKDVELKGEHDYLDLRAPLKDRKISSLPFEEQDIKVEQKEMGILSRIARATTYFFQKISSFIFKNVIFTGSKIKNAKRMNATNKQLESIGAVPFSIKNSETTIHGMHFTVDAFKEKLGIDENAHKMGFDDEGNKYNWFTLNDDAKANETLRDKFEWGHETAELEDNEGYKNLLQNKLHNYVPNMVDPAKRKQFIFNGGILPAHVVAQKAQSSTNNEARPTVILFGGSGTIYQMYKKGLIPAYLKRGINVVAYNYRGYGVNTDALTEDGFYQDSESVYQYLKQVTKEDGHEIPDEKIILHGHCVGGSVAAQLAGEHPDVNLILDRAPNTLPEAVEDGVNNIYETIKGGEKTHHKIKDAFLSAVTPVVKKAAVAITKNTLGNFETAEKLDKIKGNVFVVRSLNDETLSQQHFEKINEKLGKKAQVMEIKLGHSETWVDDPNSNKYDKQFEDFLENAGLLGTLFD